MLSATVTIVILIAIMLCVILPSVVMLSGIILIVFMANVTAPMKRPNNKLSIYCVDCFNNYATPAPPERPFFKAGIVVGPSKSTCANEAKDLAFFAQFFLRRI